jgi:hypothetical protein
MPAASARCFTPSRDDRNPVAARRPDANRIVQLALLRHPGIVLAHVEQSVEPLRWAQGARVGERRPSMQALICSRRSTT